VHMETAMACEPSLDLGMFVGGIVVGDQMHREGGGHLVVEMIEKADELLMPVAWLALGDNRAIEHVEGREQCSGPMPKVVMSHAFNIAQPHRQHRLAPLQRLDLALLVHAPHQGLVGWIEVQSHHVADLFHEEGISGA